MLIMTAINEATDNENSIPMIGVSNRAKAGNKISLMFYNIPSEKTMLQKGLLMVEQG